MKMTLILLIVLLTSITSLFFGGICLFLYFIYKELKTHNKYVSLQTQALIKSQ